MRRASHAAMAAIGAWNDLGHRLELRSSWRRRLRRRFTAAFLRTEPLRWHNTTRGLRLFVYAAFSRLDPARLPAGAGPQLVCALYGLGAIDTAARLSGLSAFERRRIELAFLRRVHGVGCLRARRLRRSLARHGATPRGRVVVRAGQTALVDWLRGIDPSPRLENLIARLPAERLLRRSRAGRAPIRQRAPAAAFAHTQRS